MGVALDIGKLKGWLHPPWTFTGMQRNEPLCGFGFALLAMALHRYDSAISASLLLRPLLFCGRMCYSLYLVHYPIVLAISHAAYQLGFRGSTSTMLVTIPVCVAATLAAGWVFHRKVERRFLNPPN